MEQIQVQNIQITDPFWVKKINLVSKVVLPYQWEALHDRIADAPQSSCIQNFIKAKNALNGRRTSVSPTYPTDKWFYNEKNSPPAAFKGWVFQDSDLYKWIEAASYALANKSGSTDLTEKINKAIKLIADAQEPDGYLDTLYTINNPKNRFENLKDFHELYCFGHLAEAACAHYEATEDKRLLHIAQRFADLICKTFGGQPGKIHGYPGHELAEMALIRLYEITKKTAYLQTAEYFILARGEKPFYFDKERNKETNGDDYRYNQAHCPVIEQREAVGHAVRSVYLYSGMADVARLTGNEELFSACKAIWQDITERKMYITGGIGSTSIGEAFSAPYYLPNQLAYAESCASVGLVFFGARMLKMEENAKYGSIMERALYNNIIGGMARDGKSFFYANPLEVYTNENGSVPELKNIHAKRQKWFDCACCPPNIARITENVGTYAYFEDENSIVVQLLIGANINTRHGKLCLKADITNSEDVWITAKPTHPFTLRIRIPDWCKKPEIHAQCTQIKNGYIHIPISKEAEIHVCFPSEIRLIKCNPRVHENAGKVAVTCGPLIYCLETKNETSPSQYRLAPHPNFKWHNNTITADGLFEPETETLYTEYQTQECPCKLTFIPFYDRLNEEASRMCVFIRYQS